MGEVTQSGGGVRGPEGSARAGRRRRGWISVPGRRMAVTVASVPVFAVAAAISLGAVPITYYNALYSWERISRIGHAGPSASRVVPAWLEPYMVDLSLVTPILICATAAFAAIGALRMMGSGSAVSRLLASRRFPFPASYRGYYVQLGLLGTIVGFVIAFSSIRMQTGPAALLESRPLILIQALGTALWSTLTALTLAYVVGPVVEAGFRGLLRVRGVRPSSDAGTALERLRGQVDAATEALGRLAESVERTQGDLDLDRLERAVDALQGAVGALQGGLSGAERELRWLVDRVAGLEASVQAASTTSDDLANRLAAVEGSLRERGDLPDRIEVLERNVNETGRILSELGNVFR